MKRKVLIHTGLKLAALVALGSLMPMASQAQNPTPVKPSVLWCLTHQAARTT